MQILGRTFIKIQDINRSTKLNRYSCCEKLATCDWLVDTLKNILIDFVSGYYDVVVQ